jgi:hypothetical protein
MGKIGIKIRIDCKKIDKARLYAGKTGAAYLTLTSFIDPDVEDQYGNCGFVTQEKDKHESKDVRLPILGNVKVFWQEDKKKTSEPARNYGPEDAEIPF